MQSHKELLLNDGKGRTRVAEVRTGKADIGCAPSVDAPPHTHNLGRSFLTRKLCERIRRASSWLQPNLSRTLQTACLSPWSTTRQQHRFLGGANPDVGQDKRRKDHPVEWGGQRRNNAHGERSSASTSPSTSFLAIRPAKVRVRVPRCQAGSTAHRCNGLPSPSPSGDTHSFHRWQFSSALSCVLSSLSD